METTEQMLVGQISAYAYKHIKEAGFGLYTAMRIIGYVALVLAETIDLEGPREKD